VKILGRAAMLDLNVLHNMWVVLSILGGLVLMLATVLTYYAVWRPRDAEGRHIATEEIKGPAAFVRWWVSFVPWVITLTLLAVGVYGITYVLAKIANPPNW
jgi:H+/Cl- antiporter ClcA